MELKRATGTGSAAGLRTGDTALDFGLRRIGASGDMTGEIVWLSALEAEGRAVVINFFATWCEPCIRELKVLEAAYGRYGGRGLRVVSVLFRDPGESSGAEIEKAQAVIRQNGLTFPVLVDRYTTRNQSAYMGDRAVLPCNFIVGRDGGIVARIQGGGGLTMEELERVVLPLLDRTGKK
jgi:thiol-disulfide isomerase/thioredoxin